MACLAAISSARHPDGRARRSENQLTERGIFWQGAMRVGVPPIPHLAELEIPMRNFRIVALALLVSALAFAPGSPAIAGPTKSAQCQAAKLKAAGKACDCRNGIAAKALASGATPDYAKCAQKLTDAFTKAETKGGCPITGEGAGVDGRLAGLVNDLSTALQASGATADAAKCIAAKLKAAGKQCACAHKAQALATLKVVQPDFSKCDAKLDAAYAKADAKATCPTTGDAEPISGQVQGTFAEVEADIADRDTAVYAGPGPYGAGRRTVTLVDSTRPTAANGTYPGAPDRTLVTDIWYPIVPNGLLYTPDAEITPTGGPFPLIVRAHGFSAFRDDSTYILRQLASWGYVVVSPDFPLSNLYAPGGPTLADVGEQARDLSFLIDTYLAANADSGSFLFGRIDPTRIGAIGHSLGGATVLLSTYHATLRDPRIKATIALSPLACVFLDNFFDTSNVPLLIEGGTADMITRYNSNHLTPYGLVNVPKYLLSFDGGTHLGFADRLLFGANENGDDAVGCSIFVHEGDPRPVQFEANLPPDFLGGPALGVDPSGSMCEPICPLPPATFMLQARQNLLAKAASISFFEQKLRGSVSGARMISGGRLDAEASDVSMMLAE
jgi:dienelactone hydrolase